MGYQVTTVDDGQLALDAITHGRYDVVFMDCQMPVMDGYQATRELRARGYAHLPIIAVTAGAIEGEREICLEAGMTDYLSKPLTLKAVADMMDRLRSSAA
jgi:CheY-like chemotaxis protein